MKKIGLASAFVLSLTATIGADLLGPGSALAEQGKSSAANTAAGTAAPAPAPRNSKLTEYSADAVQALPGREMQTGKLYVAKTGTRFEFQQRGRPIVQIKLPAQGIIRILFPLERRYIEFKGKPGSMKLPVRPGTPCKTGKSSKIGKSGKFRKTGKIAPAGVTCDMLGTTKINGLNAQRWRITSRRPAGELRVWWDPTRKIALRQEYSDGRIMQATMRAIIKFEDRDVENWEFIYTAPNGQYRRAMSLIAPELGLTVVEQKPNGAMRRLHNIKLGAPDAALFEIPKGYKPVAVTRAKPAGFFSARPMAHPRRLGSPPREGKSATGPTTGPAPARIPLPNAPGRKPK